MTDYKLGVPHNYSAVCPICTNNDAQIGFDPSPFIRTNVVLPCETCVIKRKNDKMKWYDQQARGVFKSQSGEEKVLDQRGKEMKNPYKKEAGNEHGWKQTHSRKYRKGLKVMERDL